jgi:Holliday junction resolvase RusA-like endonuclease
VTVLHFTALGAPVPAGSKRAVPVRRGGMLTRRINVIDVNHDRLMPWRDTIQAGALVAMHSEGTYELLTGPLVLIVEFHFRRPKGHYGTGRNAEQLRKSAPRWPAVQPDVTKLLRAVEDALNGILWRDDSQVVEQYALKAYSVPERAEVCVKTIGPEDW